MQTGEGKGGPFTLLKYAFPALTREEAIDEWQDSEERRPRGVTDGERVFAAVFAWKCNYVIGDINIHFPATTTNKIIQIFSSALHQYYSLLWLF